MRDEVSLEFVKMVREQSRDKANVQYVGKKVAKREDAVPRRGCCYEQKRLRALRRKKRIKRFLTGLCLLAIAIGMLVWFAGVLWDNLGLKEVVSSFFEEPGEGAIGNGIPHPEWTEDFLTINPYSRPGTALQEVNDIFVHYTANPGTDAVQNRSYFEQLKDTHERGASSHFIIGYEGDILLCVPLNEMAYAVKTRNSDSMSIECCYINEDGSFTQETYDSLIELLVWLLKEYDLSTDNILRHYDCGGKKCPLYYTENEDEWERLKQDVQKRLNEEQ